MNKIKLLILTLLCCVGSSAWGATGDVVTTIADGNYLIMCPATNNCVYYHDSNLRRASNNYLNLSSEAQFTLKKGSGDYSEFYTIQLSDGTFVTYSSTSGNNLSFSDSKAANDKNKWWSIRASNDSATEFDIIPKQDNITTSTDAWNFSKPVGGTSNQAVGFYSASDGNSRWIFICALESSPAPQDGLFDASTKWYTLTNHTNKYYMNYVADATSMSLTETTTNYEDKDLFCFVGNSTDGYCIYNKAAGSGYLLSSAMNTSDGNTGGNTYVIMTAEATAKNQSYLWDLTKGNSIDSKVGFYIGQHNNNNGKNRLNNRSSKLAYWNGGADAGSTFLATETKYSLNDLKVGQVIRLHNSTRNNTDKSVSNNNHQLSGNTFSATDVKQLWFVESGSTTGTYRLRNLYDGQYIKAGASSGYRWTTVTSAISPTDLYYHSFVNSVSFTSNNNTSDNSSGMHLDGSSNIVSWAANATESRWNMDIVSSSATTYDIYDIIVAGLSDSQNGGVKCKSDVTPVGLTSLSNGEAFFFATANSPVINEEHPVTEFFEGLPVAGYAAQVSYSNTDGKKITVTYEIAQTTYTVHVVGCTDGKAVYNSTDYAHNSSIVVEGAIGDVTAKKISGYKSVVEIEGTDIYVIYHVTTPTDGKAYMLYHKKYDGTLRYYNYTKGQTTSISKNRLDASTFVVKSTGHNVSVNGAAQAEYPSYYFRTSDGNFLTWVGKIDSYKTDGTNVFGYSATLSPTQGGYSDWTDIVIKPNSASGATDAIAIGGRREASTGNSRYSTIIVTTTDGYNYANFADFYNGNNSNAFYLVENVDQKVLKMNINVIDDPEEVNITYKGMKYEEAMPYFLFDGAFSKSDLVVTLSPGFNATIGDCTNDEVTVTIKSTQVTYAISYTGYTSDITPSATYDGNPVTAAITISGSIDLSKFLVSEYNDRLADVTVSGTNITVNYTQTPFIMSTTVSPNAPFYGMQTIGNNYRWLQYITEGDNINKANRVNSNYLTSENMLWIFRLCELGNGTQAIQISPKTDPTKVLSYSGVDSDNKGNIKALNTNEGGYRNEFQLFINTGSAGGYAFKPYKCGDESQKFDVVDTYLNCFQGGANCISFYTKGPQDDAGSRWDIARTQSVNVTSAGWATGCLPFNATVSSNNAVAKYVSVDGSTLTKTDVTNIKAEEGFLLKQNAQDGNACTVYFTETTGTLDATTDNMMKGSVAEGGTTFDKSNTKYYILAKDSEGGLGFYYQKGSPSGASATCAQYKAVLAVPNGTEVKGFRLEDDEFTAIEGIDGAVRSDEPIVRSYNLSGQAVGSDYKGIVIKNGKKYLNK